MSPRESFCYTRRRPTIPRVGLSRSHGSGGRPAPARAARLVGTRAFRPKSRRRRTPRNMQVRQRTGCEPVSYRGEGRAAAARRACADWGSPGLRGPRRCLPAWVHTGPVLCQTLSDPAAFGPDRALSSLFAPFSPSAKSQVQTLETVMSRVPGRRRESGWCRPCL